LYGQRFTQQHLNYRSDSFWLPDTFGYNAAIPQIMQGCGIKYFYTTKIDWGDLTRFPMQSFVWRGLDGSEVISHLNRIHFIPDVSSLSSMTRELVDKRSCDMRLASYGFGDGGGGPTHAMMEFLKRSKDLVGMPKVENTTISAFMQKLEARRDELPVFDGELYLELHRGTLTKMHEVKLCNRLSEIALHDMELFSVLALLLPQMERSDRGPSVCLYEQAVEYMRGHIDCRVAEVARHCGVSESALYASFKRHGTTPNGARQALLAGEAKHLLTTTDMSVQEISDRLGFSSTSYFRKVLRLHTGKTPSQLRKTGTKV
jgi:AraC-like DNA-binding protein